MSRMLWPIAGLPLMLAVAQTPGSTLRQLTSFDSGSKPKEELRAISVGPRDRLRAAFIIREEGRKLGSIVDLDERGERKGNAFALWGTDGETFTAMEFHPNASVIVTGSSRGIVDVWDTTNGQHKRSLVLSKAVVSSLAFSKDGTFLAAGSYESMNNKVCGILKVWELSTWKEAATMRGHKGTIESIAFDGDFRQIATGGADKSIRLWDRTGTRHVDLGTHECPVWALAFSPSGDTLASGSGEGVIKLWALGDCKEMCELKGHTGAVSCLSFSPNSKLVAAGGGNVDRRIVVWDVARQCVKESSKPKDSQIVAMSFTLNGRKIVSGTELGSVDIWQLEDKQENDE